MEFTHGALQSKEPPIPGSLADAFAGKVIVTLPFLLADEQRQEGTAPTFLSVPVRATREAYRGAQPPA
jgi:hypothetical protein